MKFTFVFVNLLFLSFCKSQDYDIYFSSSVSEMVYLQRLKYLLISDLEIYAKELKSKLEIVKKAINYLGIKVNRLEVNVKNDEYHGINHFSSLRSQHLDWAQWIKFMRKDVATDAQKHIQKMRRNFPIPDDFNDALGSVLLLLDVYLIEPKDFAKGLLNDKQYNSSLNPLDLYALGQYAFKNKYYKDANNWLYLTCVYFMNGEDSQINYYRVLGLHEMELSQIYAMNLLKINNKFLAWIVVEEGLWHAPHYLKMKLIEKDFYKLTKPEKSLARTYVSNFQRCCRGEFESPKRLSCYYDSKDEPFLLLAPFKVEILNNLPFVVIYHDILYDREIEELKRLAVPTITRSTIYDYDKQANVPLNIRTSNSVFLSNSASYVVDVLRQRVADMTHLNVFKNSSDDLQVMNYGLGGYYRPHFDFFGRDENPNKIVDDRIVTVLIYMTNVQQGGATIFPALRITNFPKKGSALIFRNLDNDIYPDPSTLHSGCPVLFGSKWAATKWIYSAEQMFRKPCLPPNQLKTYDTHVIEFVNQVLGL